MLTRLHRSPDFDSLPMVIDDSGTAFINLNAGPGRAPDVDAVPETPKGMRIEDVMAAVNNGGMTVGQIDPASLVPNAPPATEPVSEAAVTEAPDTGAMVFRAPARESDGSEVEIAVESQEQLEALNRLRNGYERRENLRPIEADLARRETAIQAIEARFSEDPVGFMSDNLPDEMQLAVAKVLVARLAEQHGEVFDILLGDSVARREALLDGQEQRDKWKQAAQQRDEVTQFRQAVLGQLETLIPDNATHDEAIEFVQDCGLFLQDYARNGGTIDPDNVPSLVAAKARRYFGAAAPAVTASGPIATPPAPAPPPRVPVPAVKPAVPLTHAMMRARADAAAVTPQGAGAVPSTSAPPPKGMRIEDVASWLKNRGTAAS